jgi:metallo-beta-lactamase family protein
MVLCAEVAQLDSASAHADANVLMAWLQQMKDRPRGIFVTHGEASASDAPRRRIQTELGWTADVPEYRDELDL